MKKQWITILTFLLLVNLAFAQQSEEELVKESFDNYKSAILNDQGETAVKYVDNRTIKYYSDILETTKNADSLEIESLDLLDKLMVFSIRHRTSKENILSFDGTQLLVYAIKEGTVGKNSVMNNEVGVVEIEGDFAKGQLLSNGRETPVNFHYYKEDKTWKIDLTSIFEVGGKAFEMMQEGSGQEENEYLFTILEMMTGKKPDANIWNKVQK